MPIACSRLLFKQVWDFPGSPVVKIPRLPLQVGSTLIEELRSYMPRGMAKNLKQRWWGDSSRKQIMLFKENTGLDSCAPVIGEDAIPAQEYCNSGQGF